MRRPGSKNIASFVLAWILATMILVTACSSQPASTVASTEPSTEASSVSESTASEANNAPTVAADSSLDPDNPVTVTLWHYYTGDNQQRLEEDVAEFNDTIGAQNGVIVSAVAMGTLSELEEALMNSAKGVIHAEEMPDIFSCYADSALELNELGAVCDMSAYFTPEEQESYVASFIDDGIYDGKLLVLPVAKSTELLYVDKTALDAFSAENPGVDTANALSTWQSLYNLSKAYYEWRDGQTPDTPWDGKGFLGIDELANFLIISNKQLGVDIIDGDTSSVNLDSAALKTIFDLYYPAQVLGYFNNVGQFGSDDVKTGDLAAYVGSSSGASYFPTFTEMNNEQLDIELLAAQYPVFDGGTPCAVQQGAGMAVAKSEPAREEGACLFLKWFTDTAQNVPFAIGTGYLPVKRDAYSGTEVETELSELASSDDPSAKNIEQVYRISFETVDGNEMYAAKPFAESYSVRSTLRRTLQEQVAAGQEKIAASRQSGADEAALLAELDTDAMFTAWLDAVRTELDSIGVTYSES